jgi:tetratricopeptide (TPR) repeat protein
LIIMTKTIVATFCLIAAAHAASAQSFVRSIPTPAPFAVPAPPAPAVAPAPAPAPRPQRAPVAPAVPAPMPFAYVEPPTPPEPPTPFFFEPPDLNFDFDFAELEQSLKGLGDSLKDLKLEAKLAQKAVPQPPRPVGPRGSAEGLYSQARALIERDQYERALPILEQVIGARGTRADAAMYWKAYSLSKLTRRNDALSTLAELPKQFPNTPWLNDARALEVEIRQASGQSVSADLADDEMKVLALRGLMQSDPETALPTIEKMLTGNSSVRVKDRALFVLSQSRAPRAREVMLNVARSASNPDLRLSAVRYLGMRSDAESQKVLADVYASTSDLDTKRAIIRSFLSVNARDRLLAVAKTEKSPELRALAVQQLGAVRGGAELEELYRSETDKDVKQRILNSLIAANASDKLAQIARTEKDPDLLRTAIRSLGATNRQDAGEALRAIYASDVPVETKKFVIEALSMHPENCSSLVTLAKTERNKELQTEIVRRLSNMTNRCPAARDYMLEILK